MSSYENMKLIREAISSIFFRDNRSPDIAIPNKSCKLYREQQSNNYHNLKKRRFTQIQSGRERQEMQNDNSVRRITPASKVLEQFKAGSVTSTPQKQKGKPASFSIANVLRSRKRELSKKDDRKINISSKLKSMIKNITRKRGKKEVNALGMWVYPYKVDDKWTFNIILQTSSRPSYTVAPCRFPEVEGVVLYCDKESALRGGRKAIERLSLKAEQKEVLHLV